MPDSGVVALGIFAIAGMSDSVIISAISAVSGIMIAFITVRYKNQTTRPEGKYRVDTAVSIYEGIIQRKDKTIREQEGTIAEQAQIIVEQAVKIKQLEEKVKVLEERK